MTYNKIDFNCYVDSLEHWIIYEVSEIGQRRIFPIFRLFEKKTKYDVKMHVVVLEVNRAVKDTVYAIKIQENENNENNKWEIMNTSGELMLKAKYYWHTYDVSKNEKINIFMKDNEK